MRLIFTTIFLATLAQSVWGYTKLKYEFNTPQFVEKFKCLEALENGRSIFRDGPYEYVIFEQEIFRFFSYGDEFWLEIICEIPTPKSSDKE